MKSIVFLAASCVAFSQTPSATASSQPGAERTFYFAHAGAPQAMQEIATSVRTIGDMSQVSVDESKKSLTAHGTADQLALAEWLFHGLDVSASTPPNPAIHEYRASSGGDNVVRLFYLNRGQTVQEFQEFATLLRTIGDIRRVFTTNESKILALRGTADQAAMADWLTGEIEKSAAAPRQHSASAQYQLPSNPGPAPNENTMQVFYVGNAATVQSFQEAATLIRTISDMRRVFTYNTPRAMAVRGTADQVALAAWLFDRVDKPANAAPSPPSGVYNYQAVDPRDNSVQVFYLPHTATPADFQKIATQVRTAASIRRVYTYNAPRVMALRGTVDQLAQAERLLKQLDSADLPADQ
jgi:hypothetical protein